MNPMHQIFISLHCRIFKKYKLTILMITCLCTVISTSCRKSLSTLDQMQPNHFAIVLPTEQTMMIRQGLDKDTLKALIRLPGQTEKAPDTSKYSFVWTTVSDAKVVGRKAFLTVADFDGIDPTKNTVQVAVTEKSTGLLEKATADVFITTSTREGWVILGENAGQAQIGMLGYTDNGYKKILNVNTALGKNISFKGKPVSISAVGTDKTNNASLLQWIGVTTDQEIKLFASMDFSEDPKLSQTFTDFLKPTALNPVVLEKAGYNALLSRKGTDMYQFDLYYIRQLNIVNPLQMNVITVSGVKKTFPASPMNVQVGPVVPYKGDSFYRVLYDNNSFNFVFDDGYNTYGSLTKYISPILPFSMNGFQLKAIRNNIGASGGNDVILALLNNPTSQESYLIQFLTNGFNKDVKKITTANATDMMNARFVEIDYNTGYVVYTKGNAIYGYDPTTEQNFLLIDFGNENISLMKFEKFTPGSSKMPGRAAVYKELFKRLVVCTYDPANPSKSGTFRLYRILLGRQAPIAETIESGFPKIIDTDFVPIH